MLHTPLKQAAVQGRTTGRAAACKRQSPPRQQPQIMPILQVSRLCGASLTAAETLHKCCGRAVPQGCSAVASKQLCVKDPAGALTISLFGFDCQVLACALTEALVLTTWSGDQGKHLRGKRQVRARARVCVCVCVPSAYIFSIYLLLPSNTVNVTFRGPQAEVGQHRSVTDHRASVINAQNSTHFN
jgi:hypothetical protein